MRDGFIKVAAGTPKIRVADCRHNAEAIIALMGQAAEQGVKVLTLPELCLTGSTCGDLFLQDTLLSGAERALEHILAETKELDLVTVLGLPVRGGWNGKTYNCAAVFHRGSLLALVPKQNLSGAELRWFAPGRERELTAQLASSRHLLISSLGLFSCSSLPGLTLGVEVGDDGAALVPPSAKLAAAGATLILNPAAAAAMAGHARRRRDAVCAHSARLLCGYIRAEAGEGESTTDFVFTGQHIISECGHVLAEGTYPCSLTVSEIDVQRLVSARRAWGSFPAAPLSDEYWQKQFSLELTETSLTRPISPMPFVPSEGADRAERCGEILRIAALGLKKRLEHTGASAAVIGLSGGLDSTLAILITAMAFDLLGRDHRDIIAVTMPCFGTTARTKSNAELLAEELGATLKVIDIGAAVRQHFSDIGHDMDDHSVTFENAQARERTQVLMDVANQYGGLVIGTGDLSELALGWATYNGDHMSMYGVNGSIPKTLIRYLVAFVAETKGGRLARVLRDILDTPVSPELLPPKDGEIAQRTEDLVGPYELHDFFLYYAIRWSFPPRKVFRLALYALGDRYDRDTLLKWLNNFYRRFFAQQFKRSCLPDGPKAGSLTLSPRGDWQMPSDAAASLWLAELEGLL